MPSTDRRQGKVSPRAIEETRRDEDREEVTLAFAIEHAEADYARALAASAIEEPLAALNGSLSSPRALRRLFRDPLATPGDCRAKEVALETAVTAALACKRGEAAPHALGDALAALRLHRRALDALADGVPPSDTGWRRIVEARRHADAARARLVAKGQPIAARVARRHRQRGIELDDLFQEANIGLMRAVDRFDPRRGIRFRAYAFWWARQQVLRALVEHVRTIRVPLEVAHAVKSVGAAQRVFRTRHGRDASAVELLATEAVSATALSSAAQVTAEPFSLEGPVAGGKELADFVPDRSALAEEALAESQMEAELGRLLSHLPPRHEEVVRRRFGLHGSEAETLQEIGDSLGITRERVREIETVALKRLRGAPGSRVLATFLAA